MKTKVGKHKKVYGFAGGPPRGPERWARAAHSGLARPNTPAGKLYLHRATVAHKVRETYGDNKGSVAFFEYQHRWPYPDAGMEINRAKPKYYTCSLFCTAMQAQLDFGTECIGHDAELSTLVRQRYRYRDGFTEHSLPAFLNVDERIDSVRPSRTVRCQVCGTSIKP